MTTSMVSRFSLEKTMRLFVLPLLLLIGLIGCGTKTTTQQAGTENNGTSTKEVDLGDTAETPEPEKPTSLGNVARSNVNDAGELVSLVFESETNDDGLKLLAGKTSLTTVSLRDTKITDAGLENLKGLTNLNTLVLTGTGISDAGIEPLAKFGKLQTVWLQGTKVSATGVERLQQALPNCVIIGP